MSEDDIDELTLYRTAFYYSAGLISTFEWYEDIDPIDLCESLLQRSKDIILEKNREKEKD
jgi:hypothetical protein